MRAGMCQYKQFLTFHRLYITYLRITDVKEDVATTYHATIFYIFYKGI